MHLFLIILTASACTYPLELGKSCEGRDTRTVLGEFSMIWMWLSLTIIFIFGMIISIIRDIVPRPPRTDTTERYLTGESRNVFRFLIEEYLFTGWIVSKTEKRFSNTARWSIIILIIYSEMFITGALYQRDYSNPDSFKSRDFVYGLIATIITFVIYFAAYFLLVLKEKNERFLIRNGFGYALVATMSIICLVFVFVFTYEVHDDTSVDYTNLVNHWLSAFGYSVLLEGLISENIRLITRAVLIWSKRFDPEENMQTNIELSNIERSKVQYESEEFD